MSQDWVGVREDTLAPVSRRPREAASGPVGSTGWRPTASLVRSLLVGVPTAMVAVVWGRPDLWVLGAPLLVAAALAVHRRPSVTTSGTPSVTPGARFVPEGWSTPIVTSVAGLPGAETLTWTHDDVPAVDPAPPRTAPVSPAVADHRFPTVVTVRRWGVRDVGSGTVAATSPWSGWRWGPVRVDGSPLTALPGTTPFTARSQAPDPVGLVGAHRASRVGDGSEFAGIRPFVVGDRLRRINWRVSLATGDLHVVQTHADQDTAVLLVVDASADVGRSTPSTPSSLDLTVRAAAALAEHHLRLGDRVGLRVLGTVVAPVGFGSGAAHRMRILHTLAQLGRGRADQDDLGGRLQLRAPEGTVVLMLTPMLTPRASQVAATIARGALPLVVVDTLPEAVEHRGDSRPQRAVAETAWRFRLLERAQVLDEVARSGIAVVRWRGPGTLDDVMRRLSRRARLPRLVRR